MSETSRLSEGSWESEALAGVMHLYSIPRVAALEADAVVVFPGLGEDWRIREAVRIWNHWVERGQTNKFFLLAGHNKNERTWKEFTRQVLSNEPFLMQHSHSGRVRLKEHEDNTKTQVEWVVKEVLGSQRMIKSLALVVSPYHLLRAYLTLLGGFTKHIGSMPVMVPVPTQTSGDSKNPEFQIPCWDLVAGELDRIRKYQEKGDIANFGVLKDYLSQIWRMMPLVKHLKS